MMRVLIASPFYPPDRGGISYHVGNLANRLAGRGWNVRVLACSHRKTSEERSDNLSVQTVMGLYPPGWPLQTLSNFAIPVGLSRRLLGSIREFAPNVVHLHGHHYPMTWLAAVLARACDLPVLLTLHGMYALSPRRPHGKSVVEDIFNRTVFATVMEMCDAVIAPGKNAVKYAERFMLARRPSYIIPNGVEVKKYLAGLDRKHEFRQKYGLPETSRIVLFAGRLTYGKGVPELLEAIRYFGNEGAKTTFVLAGDGPLEPIVREMSKHLENLISLGWVPQDRIHEVFAASDVFVLPSRWEIQSVSLIEAMASHLRVVATRVGDVPSVLEGYPRKNFIRGFKAIDIVEAIRQAISCPDNSEGLDPQVVEHVRNFDWDVVVRSYERIYLRLIQSHKGRERRNYLENPL